MKHKIQVLPDTIFVFDLHGVIFRLDPIQIARELMKCQYRRKLFSLILYPRVFAKTIRELRNGAIAEEILLKLANLFPQFNVLLPLGFDIINSQKPMLETIEAIKSLKAKGHKLYILSNIGEKSMAIMQNKFPEIFAHFDGVSASTAGDGYIKKPNHQAYEKYLSTFNQERQKIVFIDDRKKNIVAANDLNIPTILFESPKKFHKLLKDSLII